LKPSYWQTGVRNLEQIEAQMALPTLFDEDPAA
jgi:hypothetical protein